MHLLAAAFSVVLLQTCWLVALKGAPEIIRPGVYKHLTLLFDADFSSFLKRGLGEWWRCRESPGGTVFNLEMTPPTDVGQPGRREAGGGCTSDSDIWVRDSCGRDQHFSNNTVRVSPLETLLHSSFCFSRSG